MPGVEGRVVVVTGAGNGLGREYALLLARSHAKVVVNDLGGSRDGSGGGSAAADAVVQEIHRLGGEGVANYDSVASEDGGEAIVATALDAFGRIDGVVANAGILRDSAFHKMSTAAWDSVLEVHLSGAYHVIRAAWPLFRQQQHGRVVVATSTSGLYGNFGQANYGAAKSGLIGLTNTLSVEGAKFGILVNAVAPMAATRMTEDIATAEVLARLSPGHVAPVVGYLLSDECTDSGAVLVAGGGQVHRVRQYRGRGVSFAEMPSSIDEVAARWGEIMDLSDAAAAVAPGAENKHS